MASGKGTTKVNLSNYKYEWIIEHSSVMGNKVVYNSPKIITPYNEYAIIFAYDNYIDESAADIYLTLLRFLDTNSKKRPANCNFMLKFDNGVTIKDFHPTKVGISRKGIENVIKEYTDSADYEYVCTYEKYLKSSISSITKFEISCDIDEVTNVVNCDELHSLKTMANLPVTLKRLYESKEFSDITIISADGKEFLVHKNIIANVSSVFMRMLKQEMLEKYSNKIIIDDINGEVLSEMITFMYTGDADVNKLSEDLLYCADKYDLTELKYLCENSLYKSITVDNACRILNLAVLHAANSLKEEALKYIKRNLNLVRNTDDWLNLSGELRLQLLEI